MKNFLKGLFRKKETARENPPSAAAERTDMAIELINEDVSGCVINTEAAADGIKRTDVEIRTDGAAKRLGKPKGFYSTIETNDVSKNGGKTAKAVSDALCKVLTRLIKENVKKENYTVLVAGLGNASMTADSLGPRVCKRLIVTRHTDGNKEGGKPSPSLCAIAPGVFGVTGIETYDVISGLTEKIKPDILITVDSLSSRAVSRLATAYQVTDSGIEPGSGVNNHRFRLDKKTLGVPVLAVGVPLVVYASTIASEVFDEYFRREKDNPDKSDKSLKAIAADRVVGELLGDMVVTPKDIDVICEDCASVIATALNSAVHAAKKCH